MLLDLNQSISIALNQDFPKDFFQFGSFQEIKAMGEVNLFFYRIIKSC